MSATKKMVLAPIEQYVVDFVISLREKKNKSQEDIADIIGVSRSYVKDIENPHRPAKYNLKHINALADYFTMSPGAFLPKHPFPIDSDS
ncbi:MAG: helix-turn-helix transcriptional regulator [Niabella sp.]|nr:helix-turn-helix transcriptional regulator [Niabella sp.]